MLMNCLDKYRGQLIHDINKNLRIILLRPEEEAVHQFRVGIKRLTAIYYFLNEIDPGLDAKKILKPHRSVFKSVGKIRDWHIAIQLITAMDELDPGDRSVLNRVLKSRVNSGYRQFQRQVSTQPPGSVRTPTVRSSGISERAILRHKPVMLASLLRQILATEGRMNTKKWHKKRILLKRYQHLMDSFLLCPGHQSVEAELKQIKMLQQLLGDWHDRVVAADLLASLPATGTAKDRVIATMQKQEGILLGAAQIYLRKFARWHQDN